VDTFGAQLWSHNNVALLQFFDTRYAQSGWHNMTEFVVEYYDGVGYDGEPLKVVDVALTTEQSDSTVWLNNLTPTGAKPESPSPSATITEWDTYVYGQWDNKLLASWIVPNPSADYRPDTLLASSSITTSSKGSQSASSEPLTVLFYEDQGYGSVNNRAFEAVAPNVVVKKFQSETFTMTSLVYHAEMMSLIRGQSIGALAINQHATIDQLWIGRDCISSNNFFEREYDGLFKELKTVLAEGAQMQFFGCAIAGPNPYDNSADYSNVENECPMSYEYNAWKARRMLSTIASITEATVFASSDINSIKVKVTIGSTGWVVQVTPNDYCLEFVVGPDGYQIPYEETLPDREEHPIRAVFETSVWVPEPQVGDNLVPLDLDSEFYPRNRVDAGGEDQNVYWAPLNWWRSW
jgi:hypothetical protein